jgi:hypothetical protein
MPAEFQVQASQRDVNGVAEIASGNQDNLADYFG